MTPSLLFLTLLLGSGFFLFTIHALLNRLSVLSKLKLSRQGVAILSFFAGYLGVGVLAWHVYLNRLPGSELWQASSYAFLVYSGFGYSYFHFFNMSETARRIKILCHLYSCDAIGSEDMKIRFIPEEQIHHRLQRLLALGQLEKNGGRYRIRSHVLWCAAVVVSKCRKLLKL